MLEGDVFQNDDGMFGGVLLQQGLEVGAAGGEDHLVSLAALAVAWERTNKNNQIPTLLCISLQARVTSQKDFSSLRCLKEATMLVWKSFHLRQNCCWSSIFLTSFSSEKKLMRNNWNDAAEHLTNCGQWPGLRPIFLFQQLKCRDGVAASQPDCVRTANNSRAEQSTTNGGRSFGVSQRGKQLGPRNYRDTQAKTTTEYEQ